MFTTNHPTKARWLGVVWLFLWTTTAAGGEMAEVTLHLDQGKRAFAARRFDEARRCAETAYRLGMHPRTLVMVAEAYYALQKSVEAADLARRYLLEPTERASDVNRRGLQAMVDGLRERTGEITLVGPAGALVSLDQRVVGMLPLRAPLLLRPGTHELRIDSQGDSAHITQSVAAAEQLSVTLKLPERVLLLPEASLRLRPTWPDQAMQLTQEVSGAAYRLLSSSEQAVLLRGDPALEECLERPSCQQRLAVAARARWILALSASPHGGGCLLTVELRDGATLASAARRAAPLVSCGVRDQALFLPVLARDVLERRNQPSQPLWVKGKGAAGAVVRVDGQTVGSIPLVLNLAPVNHHVRVTSGSRTLYDGLINVEGPSALTLTAARARPRGRIAGGVIMALAGAALMGVGASGLALRGDVVAGAEGRCARDERGDCQIYDSAPLGGALLGVGGAVLIGGILTAAIPRANGFRDSFGPVTMVGRAL